VNSLRVKRPTHGVVEAHSCTASLYDAPAPGIVAKYSEDPVWSSQLL
jgi:hypothetical protein